MAFATHRMILKVRYLLTNLIINNYLILSFFIKILQYSQDIILYSHLMILHIKNTLTFVKTRTNKTFSKLEKKILQNIWRS